MMAKPSVSLDGRGKRRGVVLLAVMVVLVLLSLAAWQYTDLMIAENQASENYHKAARVKALADSGVHYAAALLSDADNMESILGNNPFDNPEVFGRVDVLGADGKPAGFFRLIAPVDPRSSSGGPYRAGVIDETGKINPNAVMKKDPTGQELFEMLKKLNIPPETAAAMIDWIDPDSDPFDGGQGMEDYSGLGYRAHNGPLDTLDEFLLVRGVTEGDLYGADKNRNGIWDPGEDGGPDNFNRGWSAFLTVHSREQAVSSRGDVLPYINTTDMTLEELHQHLIETLEDEDMAKFVILYRQYGPSTSGGQNQSLVRSIFSALTGGKSSGKGGSKGGGKSSGGSSTQAVPGKLGDMELDFSKQPKREIKSLFQLVNTQVTVPGKDKQPPVVYSSPLNDKAAQKDLLPRLFESVTVFGTPEIPARVNINTAPEEVLKALPELTEKDINAILQDRPSYTDSPDPIYLTPAWLLTQAELTPAALTTLEKLITTRGQVFKVQVLATLVGPDGTEGVGPAARVEAVIDTNGGRPRILHWRDLSELGRTIGVMGR